MALLNSILSDALLAAIVVLLALRTMLDVLFALNMAPRILRRWMLRNRREEFREYIRILGLEEQVKRARSTAQILRVPREFTEDNTQLQHRLESIVSKFIDVGNYRIGSVSRQTVSYFVNLRHAFCSHDPAEEFDRVLAEIMIAFVANTCRDHGISFDLVISRRNGLDVLGYLVAKTMDKPFLLYSAGDGVWQSSTPGGEYARRSIDYEPSPTKRAVIVDDSCVGGGDFRDMARELGRHNVTIEHVFVLFCRGETDAASKMRSEGLSLHALDSYSDDRLAQLRASRR